MTSIAYPALKYTGEAPYGSCYQQCLANLLAWRGLPGAESVLTLSWGAQAYPDTGRLAGSPRFLQAANRTHDVGLTAHRFADFVAAFDAESAALGDGPVAAAVDAFYLRSPYEGIEHLAHCVLLVSANPNGVVIIDPMNQPIPVAYSVDQWRDMRSGSAAENFLLFTARSRTPAKATAADVLSAWAADVRENAADLDEIALYAKVIAESGLLADVSGLAAERMYLTKLARYLTATYPELEPIAAGFASLTRRWYLVHTLARESGRTDARVVRMVRDLIDREKQQLDLTLTTLEGR